jgi:transcriptional regulator with XRE-family HTH domain
MPSETIGERLQRLRQAAGFSQSQLAKAADVPVGTLRNWEQGRRVPLLDAAGRLAKALGVSVDALVSDASAVSPAVAEPRPRGQRQADAQTGGVKAGNKRKGKQ